MKISKLLLIISVSALLLSACQGRQVYSSPSNDSSQGESSQSISSNSTSEARSTTVPSIDYSSVISSSSISSSVDSQVSSNVDDTTLVVNLYNPSCGSVGTEVLSDRLKNYINGLVDSPIISNVVNESCQITNDIPKKGDKVLQIGASSTIGILTFTFTQMVKAITVNVQTYHKPYTNYQTGELVPNVDSNSVLTISSPGEAPDVTLDLAPENGEPAQKEFTMAINSHSLKFYNTDKTQELKGRVFIKSLTLFY